MMNLDDKLAEIHEIPFPAVRVLFSLIQIFRSLNIRNMLILPINCSPSIAYRPNEYMKFLLLLLLSLLNHRHKSKRPRVCLSLHLIIGILVGLLGSILQIYFGDQLSAYTYHVKIFMTF